MSYVLKYRYSFVSRDDIDCRVDFYIKDAEQGLTILNPGERPFILREFNGDQNFFKHIRPFIAEMEILSTNVSMDDFLHNEDDGVKVQFYWNNSLFWAGWLMQDDFQENWIDTNHFITLRATDGLGTIGSDPMPEVVGQAPIIDYIGYALQGTALQFLIRYVVCNLFYEGQDDRNDGYNDPLWTITVDGRTFEGETKDEVLRKVMEAWSMTVYQYRGHWYVARLEEWLTNESIRGLFEESLLLDPNTPFTKTYETNIGVDEAIKPIMPEMLRSIKRPSKRNKISFYYRFPEEIVQNQFFTRGSLIIPTTDRYTIDSWTLIKGNLLTPSTGTADFYRLEIKDTDGFITDNFMFIAGDSAIHWAKSTPIILNTGDSVEMSIDFKGERNIGTGKRNQNIANVEFVDTDNNRYWLDDDGRWRDITKSITMVYSDAESPNDWKTKTVRSNGVPSYGFVYFYLQSSFGPDTDAQFKGLEIIIRENSKQPGVVGDYDKYETTDTVYNDYLEETFLDDSNNRQHKGALHFNGDLTGDNWYRMDFPDERLTFKRHKAIAHMFLNKRYRQRLEVNLLGNTWMDGATKRPIWLQNKFIFTDDAPTKKYMITNLAEMDFQSTTWKASLLEVWDEDIDDNNPGAYPTHTYGNIYQKDV